MSRDDPYAHITPADSTKTFHDVLQDAEFIRLAAPNLAAGDPCFDFDLAVYDFSSGKRQETGETFHLLDACADRPVALLFGSYT